MRAFLDISPNPWADTSSQGVLSGLISGAAYIRGGLCFRKRNSALEQARVVLIKELFVLTGF